MSYTNQMNDNEESLNKDLDIIKLNSILVIENLENNITDYFLKNTEESKIMIIDMSECTYVVIESLVRIISFVADRERKQLKTYIALPKSKDVRDFMRAWRFPQAIYAATKVRFHNLVSKESSQYFGENDNPNNIKYTKYLPPDEGMERLLANDFFPFISREITNNPASAIVEESNRWQDDLVRLVLKKNLKGPNNYIPSRIIYESLSNACRHPKASLMQIVSMFNDKSKSYDFSKTSSLGGHFTIVIWDDGTSMIDTLKKPIQKCELIHTEQQINNYTFDLSFVDQENKITTHKIKSDYLPNKETPDYKILLATIFPGITCDPSGKNQLRSPDIINSRPGMGLFILINAVIDVFGGSVSFRTGNYFMNIKKIDKNQQNTYNVKIKQYSELIPYFLGNMVTIRLPGVNQ